MDYDPRMISAAPYLRPDIPQAFLSGSFVNQTRPDDTPVTPGYYLEKIADYIRKQQLDHAVEWIMKLEIKYPELREYQAHDLLDLKSNLLAIAEKILSDEELLKLRRLLGQNTGGPAPAYM